MPRKKQKPFKRLPNGFGSIKKLSGNRRNPYAVYGPSLKVNGVLIPGPLVGYTDSWEHGYEMLVLYKANREWEKKKQEEKLYTFAEVYEMYYKEKYEDSLRQYGYQSKYSTQAAYKNCSVLHDKIFNQITYNELQANIDSYIDKLKHSSLELIKTLYNGMYKYALKNDIAVTDYAKFVEIRIPDDDENGIPFTEQELQKLWENSNIPEIRTALILCYSGWRITEFRNVDIDLEKGMFYGGMKTDAGKNRCVPINPGILHLVKEYKKKPITSVARYRTDLYASLEKIGIEKHTPHDCRHTFSWLCDRYKVDRLSKKLMIGHALGEDITDSVYGHRTDDELRTEISKIICY